MPISNPCAGATLSGQSVVIELIADSETIEIHSANNFPPSIASVDLRFLSPAQRLAVLNLYLYNNQLTAAPDVSACVSLQYLYLSGNQLTAAPDVSACVSLQTLDLSGNQLTQSAVDAVLSDLVGAGSSGGYAGLAGGANASPSAAGLASKATLEGRGWQVDVN